MMWAKTPSVTAPKKTPALSGAPTAAMTTAPRARQVAVAGRTLAVLAPSRLSLRVVTAQRGLLAGKGYVPDGGGHGSGRRMDLCIFRMVGFDLVEYLEGTGNLQGEALGVDEPEVRAEDHTGTR